MIPKNTKRKRFLWYGEESDALHDANFYRYAGWSAAGYNCEPGSEASEEEEGDNDEGDDTELSGYTPPTTMDASTPHPLRSPRKPSPSPTVTVN